MIVRWQETVEVHVVRETVDVDRSATREEAARVQMCSGDGGKTFTEVSLAPP